MKTTKDFDAPAINEHGRKIQHRKPQTLNPKPTTTRLCASAVQKPRKITVPLAEGLAWRGQGAEFCYQEKLDGRFAVRELSGAIVVGELMADGRFFGFDCVAVNGQDIRQATLRERLQCLDRCSCPQPARGNGGEFLEAVLARGGEGIVAKRWDAPYSAGMWACKRLETFYCVVTRFNGGTQSVQIAILPPGFNPQKNEFGNIPEVERERRLAAATCRLPLLGGKCDRVRVGSILKVEGFGLTAAGKIREPRICKDTPTSWLVKY